MSLKWYFNASPKALGTQGTSYSIGFTSAGTHFTILRNGTVFKEKFYLYYNDTEAYKSGWKNSAYRTITFDTEPTGALLTYLEANATAIQEDPYKFKHYHRNNRLIGTGQYRFRPFTAAEPADVFEIINTLTNVTADGENPSTIAANDSVTLIYTANSGYTLPASVTVTGASYTWEQSTGVLDISNPTQNVTITIAGVKSVSYTVMITNTGNDPASIYQGDTADSCTEFVRDAATNGQAVACLVTKPYLRITSVANLSYNSTNADVVFNSYLSGGDLSFKVNGNGSISFNASCLTGDTLITLTDGSQKRIDEITTADKVLSINPETNELEADEIIYCDSAENKTHTEYDIYTLSDGTEIKTVHRHRFYNMERQAMVYMDEWNIGEHFIKIDGSSPALVSHEKVIETVKHYTIFTKKNQNYFANGALSGNRFTKKITIKGDSQDEID